MENRPGIYLFTPQGEKLPYRLVLDNLGKWHSIRMTCRKEFYLTDKTGLSYAGAFDTQKLIQDVQESYSSGINTLVYAGTEYSYDLKSSYGGTEYSTPVILSYKNGEFSYMVGK